MNEKLPEPDEVFLCGLSIEQQKLYIKNFIKRFEESSVGIVKEETQ